MNKQKIIQVVEAATGFLSILVGLMSQYWNIIPSKYVGLAVFLFAFATNMKSILAAFNVYLVGPGAIQPPSVQAKLPDPLPRAANVQ